MPEIKTVVVAGGAGFIGAHLCERLLEDGYRVVCLDNFLTGRAENIAQLQANPNFELIEHDITQPLPKKLVRLEATVVHDLPGSPPPPPRSPAATSEEIPSNRVIRVVINLASPASPVDYQKHPLETLRVCSLGTERLLELASTVGARFVHASTSEVYGDPEEHPQRESYWGHANLYGPRSMYDEGKRYAEALIWSFRRVHNVRTGIIRIFNTYGPKMKLDDGRVVSNFLVQALRGQPLTIYGDGRQTRSFCYVSDLVNGIVKMAESEEEGPINLGDPTEFTITELADLVLRLTGSTSGRTNKPMPVDDPKQRQPDIRLAKVKLGWEPKISLEDGLKLIIPYFQTQITRE